MFFGTVGLYESLNGVIAYLLIENVFVMTDLVIFVFTICTLNILTHADKELTRVWVHFLV